MISGKNIVGYRTSAEGGTVHRVLTATDNQPLSGEFMDASINEVNQAMELAASAASSYAKTSGANKAIFLRAIAQGIEALGDDLVNRAMAESGLPEGRIRGERGRTMGQLRLFADLVEEGSWLDARIDTAIPDRAPAPKPDVRRMMVAVGPIVVFGASNFPLAFSTAGGDTASALAAGCPVVVKSHPAHAGTSELVAGVIREAAQKTGMPEGVFSHLNGGELRVGQELVLHPEAKGVAFTGSLVGGKALYDLAQSRPEPIPVFAEMGSINPVLLLPEALADHGAKWAKSYASSITLGAGQFCTNPGLLLGIDSEELNAFVKTLSSAIQEIAPSCMLHQGIANSFRDHRSSALSQEGVQLEGESNQDATNNEGRPAVASVSGAAFLQNPALQEEVFGPYSLVVKCADAAELKQVLQQLQGQLTGTVLGTDDSISNYQEWISILQTKVGRIIFNSVPTGVEVCSSMHHGGPFPSTTDARFTSVGTAAIDRFVRPMCYQDWPHALLPAELQDSNPLGIWRLVNGIRTEDAV